MRIVFLKIRKFKVKISLLLPPHVFGRIYGVSWRRPVHILILGETHGLHNSLIFFSITTIFCAPFRSMRCSIIVDMDGMGAFVDNDFVRYVGIVMITVVYSAVSFGTTMVL
jgi:hypothetical protein